MSETKVKMIFRFLSGIILQSAYMSGLDIDAIIRFDNPDTEFTTFQRNSKKTLGCQGPTIIGADTIGSAIGNITAIRSGIVSGGYLAQFILLGYVADDRTTGRGSFGRGVVVDDFQVAERGGNQQGAVGVFIDFQGMAA